MHNRQAVTTSLQVAKSFEKQHKNVLQSIQNLAAENSATRNMFVEGTYVNRGKEYPMVYMNRDGFSLLAMGFTGAKALQFKLAYIEAFNEMEDNLRQHPQPLTLPEQIQIIAQGYDGLAKDVEDIKNRMGLPGNMAHTFSKRRNAKVIEVLGGKKSNAYEDKTVRSRVYRALFSSYCETFNQDRYNDLPMKDFDKALAFIENWYPPFELQQVIQDVNAQMTIL
ncbi:Rha family transcriptional regulator [Limosilactobacillus pontis]|uniref:Rha family transcriptional regulator n=1 Tax=Limosilactobacillus pontis TaxID=35787 RepID=UPI0025A4BC57|nr:Rha family transcriptional regulator [Limosilactobacillus pontis]MDM8332760.1 Rha family transcriptional regulator [Limosilactobacillus pontis]